MRKQPGEKRQEQQSEQGPDPTGCVRHPFVIRGQPYEKVDERATLGGPGPFSKGLARAANNRAVLDVKGGAQSPCIGRLTAGPAVWRCSYHR
jgi:hypothetical protein